MESACRKDFINHLGLADFGQADGFFSRFSGNAMDIKVRVIKKRAASAMEGHFGTAVLGMLAVTGIHFAGGILANSLFSGSDLLNVILGRAFLFIAALVAAVFSAGQCYLYLNIARGREARVGDIFYFFQNQPDRVIIASFVLATLDLVATIPYYYYVFTASPGKTTDEQLHYLILVLVLLLSSSALNVILTTPFAMSYYLLADDPSMNGWTALKSSVALMKGNMMKYLLMELSFVPMLLLSVLTLYIVLIWVLPHLFMSETIFYLKRLEYRQREEEDSGTSGSL